MRAGQTVCSGLVWPARSIPPLPLYMLRFICELARLVMAMILLLSAIDVHVLIRVYNTRV